MNKSHILQEIKRTAEANGGKPLGSTRFRCETGIKESEWQKHWARWGDALREANFAPNEFQGPYDTTVLFEKYAKLSQELGKLPGSREFRVKRHKNPDFPSYVPISRLGRKAELVRQLAEFCRSREGYEDVLRMCEAYSPRQRDSITEIEPSEPEIGFVYLIKSGRHYKLGKTNSAGRRERELAIQLPEKTKTVHVIRTDDPYGIEAYWHKRFEPKRKNNEWFELTSADISAFKRRKFM